MPVASPHPDWTQVLDRVLSKISPDSQGSQFGIPPVREHPDGRARLGPPPGLPEPPQISGVHLFKENVRTLVRTCLSE